MRMGICLPLFDPNRNNYLNWISPRLKTIEIIAAIAVLDVLIVILKICKMYINGGPKWLTCNRIRIPVLGIAVLCFGPMVFYLSHKSFDRRLFCITNCLDPFCKNPAEYDCIEKYMSHPRYSKFVGRFDDESGFINLHIKDGDAASNVHFSCSIVLEVGAMYRISDLRIDQG